MIESIRFENFKALREATLPLGQFTLIVGPNGSGKSTALSAPIFMSGPQNWDFDQVRTAGVSDSAPVVIEARWRESWESYEGDFLLASTWNKGQTGRTEVRSVNGSRAANPERSLSALARSRLFLLDANRIAQPVPLRPNMELGADGFGLAGVLGRVRDQHPDNFESLNRRLAEWIPDFDHVLFETPQQGCRSICLRTRDGHRVIRSVDLSQGTLLALALLTIAYMPDPPAVVCIKDPDYGLHPRLLQPLRDILYRLAYPNDAHGGEPVQVIMTTHNSYFLEFFRGHPEQIVVTEKDGLEARFSRLSERTDLTEIVRDIPLSKVWDNREPPAPAAGIKTLLTPRYRPQFKLR
jgi:predicted ATPase